MFGVVFSTSLGVLTFAIVATFVVPLLQQKHFCYASILDLSSNPAEYNGVNCFTVSPGGTFAKVFRSSQDQNVDSGHVVPGLWDGHGHLLGYGEFLSSVDLFGSRSMGEVRERILSYVQRNPDSGTSSEWIRGVGWTQEAFGGVMPIAADLDTDENLSGKYIMLDRIDVHCIWVSKAVLQLLPNPLPDSPQGGEIVKDPGPGVFCDNAMDMVLQHWPAPGREQKRKFIKAAMAELNSFGLVGVHDAGVRPTDIELYEEMLRNDSKDFTLRLFAMRECEVRNQFCAEAARKITHPMLTVRSVKLFADGALGSWGSALIEPYTDHPWTSGSLLVNATTLTYLAKAWAAAGFQVNIHAIGDKANRLAIDALSEALHGVCGDTAIKECQQNRRFRIEHAQIVHIEDQERMHRLGIRPSLQPTHATSDMSYAEDRLGHLRTVEEAYRMRSFLSLDPILGSDFPVEPPNPWAGIYSAVTRRSPKTGLGFQGQNSSWYPEECLSLREALLGFTRGAAHGAFMEGKAGVIQKGAFADWVVLDKPLRQTDIESLRTLRVRETWVAGRMVYRASDHVQS